MQDLSFDTRDPLFEFNGMQFGVQIFTFENVYGLDPARCTVAPEAEGMVVSCRGFTWAGAQERCEGEMLLRAVARGKRTYVTITVRLATAIRSVKLMFINVPEGVIVNLRETRERAIGPDGLILRYPCGWRELYAPQVVLRGPDRTMTNIRSLDTQVRAKAIAFIRRHDRLDMELIHEALAVDRVDEVQVPAWEIGPCETLEGALAEQAAHSAAAYGLVPWEQRPDVPAWAREIALVAAIHCQHFTGYVFNDYAKELETIRWLAERIEPHRLLAYLPGWEGRYYWQYGEYRPDPRMGGEQGFALLASEARKLGVHLMPMFGINHVNRATSNYEQWGAPAAASSAGGNPTAGSVDWDGSRHYDHAWGSLLNPGSPTWQHRIVTQITRLIERYELDGVFLDISAGWWNDSRHAVYDGTVALIARLRAKHPELLVAGEGWYDALGAATPLMQSGHTDGVLHWHDEPHAPVFDTYNRAFAHLCLGDPGRGSSGAHELGFNPVRRVPLRKGIIPTVTIVEDTLRTASGALEEILEDAQAYGAHYFEHQCAGGAAK